MMTTCCRLVAVALVGLGVIAGPPIRASEQEATLRYRWAKGDTARYRHAQQSTATISGLPGSMGEMVVTTSMSQVFKVAAEDVASDGLATLRFTYEAIQTDITSPMATLSYDSAAPEKAVDPSGGRLKELFSAFVGESFTMVMAPGGEVKKIDGMTRIAEKVFSKLPQDPAQAGILGGMKTSFSDDAVKSTFSQVFIVFPGRAVKPGDTWQSDFTANNAMLGAIATAVTATLKAVEGSGANQIARIATKSTMKGDPKSAAPNPMGVSVLMNDGNAEGDLSFDVTKGRLQKAEVRSTLNMAMSGSAPDGSALNMKTFVKAVLTLELLQ